MPFAVATVALISAELLSLPAGRSAVTTGQRGAQALQRPAMASVHTAGPEHDAASFRLLPPDAPAGSTDLALYVGRRDRGAQFEFGALGGGRSDAPGLVHVGIGWDF